MRVEVLGCSGGELRRHRTTCFLVDGVLAVDAGALTAALPLDRLLAIDDIVLTHSHLDHVKDVPLVADLLVGRRSRPLRVHASTDCARILRESVFNDELWPDFTRLPDERHPAIVIQPFDPRRRFKAGRYAVRPVLVSHTVESVGLVLSDGVSSLAVSGDTGPTSAFWKAVDATENVRGLLVETSFPNRLQSLADASGHLTPRTLALELRKVRRNGFPVYLYHLKPAFAAELRREILSLQLDGVSVLSAGDELQL